MKKVNPITLQIEEVEETKEPEKKYVYLVTDDAIWDYERTLTTEVYETFDSALKKYKSLVKQTKEEIKDWREGCEEDRILEDETVNIEQEDAVYDVYEKDDQERLSDTITVQKKEVM